MRLNKHTTERIEGLTNTNALESFKKSIDTIIKDMINEGWHYEDIEDYMSDVIESKIREKINEDKDEDLKKYWVFESC
jgi:ribosomal protein S3AE